MRNRVTECEWRHATEAHRGFWGFRRKVRRVEARSRTRRLAFADSPRPDEFVRVMGAARMRGAKEEASIKRFCLSPYVEEPLNLKVIKGSYLNWEVIMCYSYFEILCSKFSICGHEHSMYISHIAVSGYGTMGMSRSIYIYQPLQTSMMWHKVNFKAAFNWFE